MATGRSPGAASRIGTISVCQTSASGSGRRRSRGTVLLRGTARSLLDAVGAWTELNPALAAAIGGGSV